MSKVFQIMFYIALVSIEFLATTTIHIEIVESIWDKANHFTAFFVLYVLLSLGYKNLGVVVKILILLAFGIQIEIVQSFIDGRSSSFLDVFADSVGIGLGIVGLILIAPHLRKIHSSLDLS